MNDLTGPIVMLIRDDPAVAAITKRVRGGEVLANDVAPMVRVVNLANTRSPFGPGRGRVGLQQPRLAINCWGTSFQQAAQLAGAVSDALHLRGGLVVSDKPIHRILDQGWGGAVLERDSGWVQETVMCTVVGAA